MIIHRGRGGLIALIAFLCFFVAEGYTRVHYDNDFYYQRHPWPKLAACLVAATLVWWLSPRKQEPPGPGMRDQSWLPSQSQQALPTEPEPASFRLTLFRETDSLFFIPVRYWPLLLCLLGIFLYFIPGANLP
jgi:hypothetical protein